MSEILESSSSEEEDGEGGESDEDEDKEVEEEEVRILFLKNNSVILLKPVKQGSEHVQPMAYQCWMLDCLSSEGSTRWVVLCYLFKF